MEKELVSVGIPFYNSEIFLADAIKSVIRQSYQNLEIILIDDGSSDGSLKIAKAFAKTDKRIQVISDGKNVGLPKRLNQLSKHAQGYYYARMDADDIMHTDRIKTQVEYLNKHTSVDLLGTGLIAIDNKNNITGLRKGSHLETITLNMVMRMTWAVHPTITGKLAWFQENLYDENLRRAQDYELWIRTVEHSKFVKLKDAYLFYREASTPSLTKYFQSTKYSLNIFLKARKKLGLINLLKLTINKLFKLAVYFVFSIFGQTNKLIERRSVAMDAKDEKQYASILNKIIS